uniref:Uncharacterized protein n=1 Tax=Parascaris univalens TaxID=6257 RepID=A0A914ZLG1_PARUN
MIINEIFCYTAFIIGIVASQYTTITSNVEIVTVLSEPFAMYVDCEDSTNRQLCEREKRLQGFCVDLLEHISIRSPHIKYRLAVVKDNKYGVKLINGSWDGLIGALTQGSAAAAIAPITKTSEREEVVDFTEPYLSTGITIMMRKSSGSEVFLLLKPFTAATWLCVILTNIIFAFVVGIANELKNSSNFDRIRKKCTNSYADANTAYMRFSLLSYVNIHYGRYISLRIATITWYIFIMFIFASYTANLIGIFLDERLRQPLTNAEDLLRQSQIKYGILSGGSTQRFFENTTNPIYRRMWNIMKQQSSPSVFVSTYAEGIERVRKSDGKYAFLLEECSNDYANSRFPCDTRKIGTKLNDVGYHIAISRKSSWLREIFNKAIMEMKLDGEMREIEEKWLHKRNECRNDDNNSTENNDDIAIRMDQLLSIFLILFAICILMIIIALYASKIFYHNRQMSLSNLVSLNRTDSA